MPCIKRCFRQCGFIDEQFEPDEIIPAPVQADFNFEDYVHCDSNLKVGAELSDETIVQSTEEILGLASVLSDDEEEQEEPPLARVSGSQANDCIRQLRAYFKKKSYDTSCQLQKLIDIESDINSIQKLEQSKLSNFFKP